MSNNSNQVPCPRCNGSGRVAVWRRRWAGRRYEKFNTGTTIECSDCKGTGLIDPAHLPRGKLVPDPNYRPPKKDWYIKKSR